MKNKKKSIKQKMKMFSSCLNFSSLHFFTSQDEQCSFTTERLNTSRKPTVPQWPTLLSIQAPFQMQYVYKIMGIENILPPSQNIVFENF